MFDYIDYKNVNCRVYGADEKAAAIQTPMRFGQAYVPRQVFDTVYPPDKALMHGTVFPELYMPYTKKP